MKSLSVVLDEYVAFVKEKQAKLSLAASLSSNEDNRKFVTNTMHSLCNLLEAFISMESQHCSTDSTELQNRSSPDLSVSKQQQQPVLPAAQTPSLNMPLPLNWSNFGMPLLPFSTLDSNSGWTVNQSHANPATIANSMIKKPDVDKSRVTKPRKVRESLLKKMDKVAVVQTTPVDVKPVFGQSPKKTVTRNNTQKSKIQVLNPTSFEVTKPRAIITLNDTTGEEKVNETVSLILYPDHTAENSTQGSKTLLHDDEPKTPTRKATIVSEAVTPGTFLSPDTTAACFRSKLSPRTSLLVSNPDLLALNLDSDGPRKKKRKREEISQNSTDTRLNSVITSERDVDAFLSSLRYE